MRWPHLLALTLGLLFAGPALWLPNLWPSFVLPGIALVTLQFVALGSWQAKDTFFKWTDYVYYLLLGAVVTIASAVMLRADEARRVDAQVEVRSLEASIAAAEQALPRLLAEQQELQAALQAADPDWVADCRVQQLPPLRKPDERRDVPALRIDPCLGYIALEGRALRLPSEIARTQAERELQRARLDDLRRRQAAAASGAATSVQAQIDLREFEIRWLTLLALLGAAIKLGKTTCSLCPLRRRSDG